MPSAQLSRDDAPPADAPLAASAGQPVAGPGSRRRKIIGHVIANGLVLLVLAAWWRYSQDASPFVFPSPQDTFRAVGKLLFDWTWAKHTYVSLARVAVSVTLAMLIGWAIVTLAHFVEVLRVFVGRRLIPFFNAFPSLGWAMLGVIWFGTSDGSVVFMETAILLPFSMINLWAGYDALDQGMVEMGHSFTRRRLRTTRMLLLPMLGPYLYSALRTSYGVGWKVALIAELFGSNVGLGYVMNMSRQNFDTPTTFAAIVVVIIMVGIVEAVVFTPLNRLVNRGVPKR